MGSQSTLLELGDRYWALGLPAAAKSALIRALAQTDDDSTGYRFPVCVADGVAAVDVDLSVRFKPVSGSGDQAAGLVWRYRDADNYYVVRANALENIGVWTKADSVTYFDDLKVSVGK